MRSGWPRPSFSEPARARPGQGITRPLATSPGCSALPLPTRRSAGTPGRTSATLSNGVTVESTDNLIGSFPGFIGGKTGHTSDAGWSQVAAVRRDGVTITAAVLGEPTESQRDADLAALLRFGLDSFRPSLVVDPSRVYAHVDVGWGLDPVAVVARDGSSGPAPTGRPLVERVVVARGRVAPDPCGAGARLRSSCSTASGSSPVSPSSAASSVAGADTVRAGPVPCPAHGAPPRSAGSQDDRYRHPQRRSRSLADRPELQRRAPSSLERGAHPRGRQGHQRRPRAEAARSPCRRDRARRRANGHADRRGAHRRGDPQRLRPDRATSRAPRRWSSTRPRARTRRSTSGGPRSRRRSSEP